MTSQNRKAHLLWGTASHLKFTPGRARSLPRPAKFWSKLGSSAISPRPNSRQNVANLNLASVLDQTSGNPLFPFRGLETSHITTAVAKPGELAISANYLCGYFCLHSKQKSGDRQWSAAGRELKKSPLCAHAWSWYTPAVNWSHHTDPSCNATWQKTASNLHLIWLWLKSSSETC